MSESRSQLSGTLLLILTVVAAVAAVISFRNLRAYPLHDDGVTWIDRSVGNGNLAPFAAYVTPGGPGERADIRVGDELEAIGGAPIRKALAVPQALGTISLPGPTEYTLRRDGITFRKNRVYIQAAPHDSAVYYQYFVGAFYLAVGLFVYYRRTSAAKSRLFYLLCLTSFIGSCFHYSGKLNAFDELIYWGNLAANLLAPAIFLHFCLTFRQTPGWLARRWSWLLLYLPSLVLLGLVALTASGLLSFRSPLLEVRLLFDRLMEGYAVLVYALGALVLAVDYRRSEDPMARRQLKYLRNGAFLGVLPFAALYALPYAFGSVPGHLASLSVLSMGLIPLTWAYAITRYRLLDVDIIFQQGYVYTLATLAVIGTFYVLIFLIFNTQTVPAPAFVVLISFATFVFQPIRRWIQEQLDRRVFYRDRYDARVTLIEFARELGSETDQNVMLARVSDRLRRTLSIQHVGFFLLNDATGSFQLHSLTQKPGRNPKGLVNQLDLQFLDQASDRPYLFFEQPKHLRDFVSQTWPASMRETISELDFTYYVACKSRRRTIAYFGVSRTTEGDFLSLDDIELLVTLSNYVAIAIENSRLYSSLQHKVDEYERLKEFSENIVESINVGILAAGLDDRVESWNAEIERLTGIARVDAIGHRLADLFPIELNERFEELREQSGVQNIYKTPLRRRLEINDDQAESLPLNGTSGLKLAHPTPPQRESMVNVAIAPLISREGKQIGRLIIFDDVTDRDELERKLVQADKLSSIGLLAAGVAHEVNTPLAVISTYAQMLTKQVPEDDHKSKLLEKIAKQTFRASEIVNSLLNFSRTSPTEYSEMELNRVIRETVSLVEHQFQKTGVITETSLSDDLPKIRGNSGKLQQVFLNLLINARDAMVSGGRVTVRTWNENGFAHVEVADTGQGIAAENMPRIYDPFFSTKGPKKGTGLGLSITYGIVQEHNGIIEVDSEVGRGTRFHLEFPAMNSVAARRQALPA